ncbi:preprotein translocase subunit SecE [Sansalvadorimonas sp. 2012CJ34-2]|uniref:Protein translocase subunit SecE n=1 Tax=Parendozoicomonas callyspongiae TaxID=2942213 RepID=A0ABT0PF59_9GAMM|nr:preprotein translocase subunit SecE [Sansalvadorimonas sp. 2012CJ34-2]MCL6270020.1 preprotein translocase subunit SecE [Sansalvadorimonas sp. 2012CJ34-2]
MSGKTDVESVSRLDGLKWAVVVALIIAGAVGNSYFGSESILYRAIGLVAVATVAVGVALQTAKGQVFWGLLRDAKAEVRKVVWPTRQETVQTTVIVVLVVLLMSLVLWGLDSLLGWIVSSLIR